MSNRKKRIILHPNIRSMVRKSSFYLPLIPLLFHRTITILTTIVSSSSLITTTHVLASTTTSLSNKITPSLIGRIALEYRRNLSSYRHRRHILHFRNHYTGPTVTSFISYPFGKQNIQSLFRTSHFGVDKKVSLSSTLLISPSKPIIMDNFVSTTTINSTPGIITTTTNESIIIPHLHKLVKEALDINSTINDDHKLVIDKNETLIISSIISRLDGVLNATITALDGVPNITTTVTNKNNATSSSSNINETIAVSETTASSSTLNETMKTSETTTKTEMISTLTTKETLELVTSLVHQTTIALRQLHQKTAGECRRNKKRGGAWKILREACLPLITSSNIDETMNTMSDDDLVICSKLTIAILLSSLSLSITTNNYNNDNNVADDIGASRAVAGAITYSFGGLKGMKVNNNDRSTHSTNNAKDNDNGDSNDSNDWNIEDSYERILKEILIISSSISSPSSAAIQVDLRIIAMYIDILNLNYITHKNNFKYRTTTQDDIKGNRISKRISRRRSRKIYNNNDEIAIVAANAVRNSILLSDVDENTMNVDTENEMTNMKDDENGNKSFRKKVTAALSFVSSFPCCLHLNTYDNSDDDNNTLILPVDLVKIASSLDLWEAAETVCSSAVDAAIAAATTSSNDNIDDAIVMDNDNNENNDKDNATVFSSSSPIEEAIITLVHIAINKKRARFADTFATRFYHYQDHHQNGSVGRGGRMTLCDSTTFVEARYAHVCSTIRNLIVKRQLPVIERQILRIDKAVQRVVVTNDGDDDDSNNNNILCSNNNNIVDGVINGDENNVRQWKQRRQQGQQWIRQQQKPIYPTITKKLSSPSKTIFPWESASSMIRSYAIEVLDEAKEYEYALRLSELWNIPYTCVDEETLKNEIMIRKNKYLGWDKDVAIETGERGGGKKEKGKEEEKETKEVLSSSSSLVLLSEPDELRKAFGRFVTDDDGIGPYGFDVEWGAEEDMTDNIPDHEYKEGNNDGKQPREGDQQQHRRRRQENGGRSRKKKQRNGGNKQKRGASLLQIASKKGCVLLVDIPALSMTINGTEALRDTVGALLSGKKWRWSGCCVDDNVDSDGNGVGDGMGNSSINGIGGGPHVKVAGFGPKQDLAVLRASPHQGDSHWLTADRNASGSSSSPILDISKMIVSMPSELLKDGQQQQHQTNNRGLSAVCEIYLGKPLDKAEQCSDWDARPLTRSQMEYAALDAWVCATLCEKAR